MRREHTQILAPVALEEKARQDRAVQEGVLLLGHLAAGRCHQVGQGGQAVGAEADQGAGDGRGG
jgi:hypothetical protein